MTHADLPQKNTQYNIFFTAAFSQHFSSAATNSKPRSVIVHHHHLAPSVSTHIQAHSCDIAFAFSEANGMWTLNRDNADTRRFQARYANQSLV